jgi:hypothetical protein
LTDESKNQGDQEDQKERQRQGKGILVYSLIPSEPNLTAVFTIDKQAPEIAEFLNKKKGWLSSSEILILPGYDYKWEEERDTIYLDSGFNNIPLPQRKSNIVKFHSLKAMKSGITLFESALEELVALIKKVSPRREEKQQKVKMKVLS